MSMVMEEEVKRLTASRVIADWIGFYNNRRPHPALGMKAPAEAFALAT